MVRLTLFNPALGRDAQAGAVLWTSFGFRVLRLSCWPVPPELPCASVWHFSCDNPAVLSHAMLYCVVRLKFCTNLIPEDRTSKHTELPAFMSSAPSISAQTGLVGSLLEFLVPSAFVLALTAQGANATSLNATVVVSTESGAKSSIVEGIHGCHYSCECGPLKDFGCEQVYHRHLPHALPSGTLPGERVCPPSPEGVCRHIVAP